MNNKRQWQTTDQSEGQVKLN